MGGSICVFFCCAWVSEWAPKLVSFFYSNFLGSWIFWVPFGSLLRPLEAFLRGLCSQNPLKNKVVFKVFENEGFWFFEAPDGSFGLILALLGRSDPKMGSKMTFNIFLKSFKQIVSKMFKKMCKNWWQKG